MTLWLAVVLIACGWFLLRQGKKLEAAYRVPSRRSGWKGQGEGQPDGGGAMKPSGAGVVKWKIQAVIDYLKTEFPGYEISHVPKPDLMGDLFQVIESSKVVHRLLVRRRFFDRYDEPERWPHAVSYEWTAERIRDAGAEIVDLD